MTVLSIFINFIHTDSRRWGHHEEEEASREAEGRKEESQDGRKSRDRPGGFLGGAAKMILVDFNIRLDQV